MIEILYKILFEVKILHEYYLRNREGKSVLDLPTQDERLDYLKQRYDSDIRSINDDVSFSIPSAAKQLYENYNLKLLKVNSGFKICVKVLKRDLGGGITGYAPAEQFPDKLCIPVIIQKINSSFEIFTNSRLKGELNAGYYFTNDKIINRIRSFPVLSSDCPQFITTSGMEQGQIAKFGTNDYREFFLDEANTESWLQYASGGFANENDRLLLPLSFYYSFPQNTAVTSASFTIKDFSGHIVSSFNCSSARPLARVPVSPDLARISVITGETIDEKLIYTLEVTGNGAYSKNYKIMFYDENIPSKNILGMVVINPKPADNAPALIDSSGNIVYRKNPNGSVNTKAPVFEIRFKSRTSFWRYINIKNKKLNGNSLTDFLFEKQGALVSKVPRPLAFTSTLYRKQADNSLHYLPNPGENSGIVIENNKVFSNILVQESVKFPLAP